MKLVGSKSGDEFDWGYGSFIRNVNEANRIRARLYTLVVFFIPLSMIAASASIGFYIGEENFEKGRFPLLNLLAIIFGILGMFLICLNGHIKKAIFISKLTFRRDMLFHPNFSDIYIEIEDAATFDKFKVTAEDFGVIRVTADMILIELQDHQVKLKRDDIKIGYNNGPGAAKGVILAYPKEQPDWEVVCVAPFQTMNIFVGGSHSAKARWLLNILQA